MKIFTFLVFTISINSFGQTKNISTSEILHLFKKSIYQPDKKAIDIVSNDWFFCNEDSAYFKKDTLKLYSNSYHTKLVVYSSNCCEQIGWTFYKKDKFVLSRSSSCRARGYPSTDKDFYTINLEKKDKTLFLQTYNQQGLGEYFRIIDLIKEKNDFYFNYQIILKREK